MHVILTDLYYFEPNILENCGATLTQWNNRSQENLHEDMLRNLLNVDSQADYLYYTLRFICPKKFENPSSRLLSI